MEKEEFGENKWEEIRPYIYLNRDFFGSVILDLIKMGDCGFSLKVNPQFYNLLVQMGLLSDFVMLNLEVTDVAPLVAKCLKALKNQNNVFTFCTVCHASWCGLQQVNIKISTIPDGDRDVKHAAVFAVASKDFPGSAGFQLSYLQWSWKGLTIIQRQPQGSLGPTVVHLDHRGVQKYFLKILLEYKYFKIHLSVDNIFTYLWAAYIESISERLNLF